MQRTLFSVALAATLSLGALAPRNSHAADGTITYNGAVTDTTCTVTGGGAATGTGDVTVQLPDVSRSILAVAGLTAGKTPFSLILGGGAKCTNGKTAALWIETTQTPALDASTGALRNQAPGGATNVQVQLINPANDQPIDLAVNAAVISGATLIAGSNQPAATIAGNTATLNYAAQYLATNSGATSGLVTTYLTYSMQYN
jgi:major type 1 subunit fimbrin (pilin)